MKIIPEENNCVLKVSLKVKFLRFYNKLLVLCLHTGCPRTRSPEKRVEIFIKGQINNPKEKYFYLERYSRKEYFNSTNQNVLRNPGVFLVIVAIGCIFYHVFTMKLLRNVSVKISFKSFQMALIPPS
jgi:hypothetical protein